MWVIAATKLITGDRCLMLISLLLLHTSGFDANLSVDMHVYNLPCSYYLSADGWAEED